MTTPPAPPAGDPPAPPEGKPVEERLGTLESAVGRIEAALGKIIPGSHAQAQDHIEQRLDRPSSIEEQVRAELERARAEESKAAADSKAKEDATVERETLETRLKALEEKPPAEPVRRAARLMGWH